MRIYYFLEFADLRLRRITLVLFGLAQLSEVRRPLSSFRKSCERLSTSCRFLDLLEVLKFAISHLICL